MTEPFPLLNTSAVQPSHPDADDDVDTLRRRRKSRGGLGGEIRTGDTGALALAFSSRGLAAADRHHLQPLQHQLHYHYPLLPHFSQHLPSLRSQSDLDAAAPTARRLSKPRGARSLVSRLLQTVGKHTFVIPAALVLLVLTGFALDPTESNPLHHLLFLSYRLPLPGLSSLPDQPPQYGKGPWDLAFVAFYTLLLSFTREFIMQQLLRPLARRTGLSRAKQARFMEQMYTALYFAVLGPAGLYVMSRTPVRYFNTRGMYEGFPHRTHEAIVKFYYLFQAAYWAQQAVVLVLGMEKPRKDFKELVGHHIVSLALIGLSYRFHFTYMGLAVYTTHDISDFFLATSKILNYLDNPLVGPYFFLFMAVWVYLRHLVNLRIIWSLFTEFRTVGPWGLDWAVQQYKCEISQFITTALLASLQALNLFWLFHIVRIAYRFVRHNIAEDDRSEDDEAEGDLGADKADLGEVLARHIDSNVTGKFPGSAALLPEHRNRSIREKTKATTTTDLPPSLTLNGRILVNAASKGEPLPHH